MSIGHALLLGLLQGATEFLPVSSSGHLVLVPWLLGWPAPDLAFDVMVHLGTAVAVVGYFWRDWVSLAEGVWQALRDRSPYNSYLHSAWLILLATIPAALVGFFLKDFFETLVGRPVPAAGFLLVTAAILTLAEGWSRHERDQAELYWLDALLVGLAQAAAIFPGISRSGSTIAMGMGRGLERESAARFSFLLATPIILGAGILQVLDLVQAQDLVASMPIIVAGFLSALISGLCCIHYLLRYLQRRPLYPFAIYCAVFGMVSLIVSLF